MIDFHNKHGYFFPLLPSTVHNINVHECSILEFKTLKNSVQSEIDEKSTVNDQPLRSFLLWQREPVGKMIPHCHGGTAASNSLCDPMDMLNQHLSSNEPMGKCFCLCDGPMDKWIVCDEPSNDPMSCRMLSTKKSKHSYFPETLAQLHLRKIHSLQCRLCNSTMNMRHRHLPSDPKSLGSSFCSLLIFALRLENQTFRWKIKIKSNF